jgi:polysaccharide export outer membrane protein
MISRLRVLDDVLGNVAETGRSFIRMRIEARYLPVFLCLLVSGGQLGCSSAPEVGTVSSTPARAQNMDITLPDVPLGPGDELKVSVFKVPELTQEIKIPRSGIVFLPLAGELRVAGLSQNELRRELTERFSRHYVDPQVSIEVTAYRSQKLVVLGEVAKPGMFTMDSPIGTLEAIGMAGGFASTADLEHVILLHQTPGEVTSEVIDLDLDGVLEKGFGGDRLLQAGDVVYVPPQQVVNWARYARNIENILRPLLIFEQVILLGYDIDAASKGERYDSTIVIPVQSPQP